VKRSARRPGGREGRIFAARQQFCLWTYQSQQKNPAAQLESSVLADPEVQRAFWQAPTQAALGATAVGDQANYAYVDQGWPPTGPTDIMVTALTQAVQGEGDLKALLADAEARLNALAGNYISPAAAMAAQASAEKAFPGAGTPDAVAQVGGCGPAG